MRLPLVLLSLFSFVASFAQQKNLTLFYSPQFLFVNAVKLDLEIQKDNNNKSSLLISPYIQMGKTNANGGASSSVNYDVYGNSSYNGYANYPDDLLGAGLNLQNKIYLIDGKPDDSRHFPYFSYGFSYLYSKISYNYGYYIDLADYSSYQISSGVDKFNIFGLQSTMGDRIELGHVFVLDIYAGIGLKYTDKSTTAKNARNYSRNVFDYGYTGIHPSLGMRLGFKI